MKMKLVCVLLYLFSLELSALSNTKCEVNASVNGKKHSELYSLLIGNTYQPSLDDSLKKKLIFTSKTELTGDDSGCRLGDREMQCTVSMKQQGFPELQGEVLEFYKATRCSNAMTSADAICSGAWNTLKRKLRKSECYESIDLQNQKPLSEESFFYSYSDKDFEKSYFGDGHISVSFSLLKKAIVAQYGQEYDNHNRFFKLISKKDLKLESLKVYFERSKYEPKWRVSNGHGSVGDLMELSIDMRSKGSEEDYCSILNTRIDYRTEITDSECSNLQIAVVMKLNPDSDHRTQFTAKTPFMDIKYKFSTAKLVKSSRKPKVAYFGRTDVLTWKSFEKNTSTFIATNSAGLYQNDVNREFNKISDMAIPSMKYGDYWKSWLQQATQNGKFMAIPLGLSRDSADIERCQNSADLDPKAEFHTSPKHFVYNLLNKQEGVLSHDLCLGVKPIAANAFLPELLTLRFHSTNDLFFDYYGKYYPINLTTFRTSEIENNFKPTDSASLYSGRHLHRDRRVSFYRNQEKDFAIFGDNGGGIVGLDFRKGKVIWSLDFPANLFPIAASDKAVFMVGTLAVEGGYSCAKGRFVAMAISPDSGQVLWKTEGRAICFYEIREILQDVVGKLDNKNRLEFRFKGSSTTYMKLDAVTGKWL